MLDLMKSFMLCATIIIASPAIPTQAEETSFDSDHRPDKWNVNFGSWEPHDGVLVCKEKAENKHAAASRWMIPLSDGEIKCKLKFEGAKFFHLGFDPDRKALDKKGHLYSLVITPQSAIIKVHRNKADPQSTDKTVATVKFGKPLTGWVDVKLTAQGNSVTALIDGNHTLNASEDTFGVKKPGVVFRVGGGEARLDDVSIKVTRP